MGITHITVSVTNLAQSQPSYESEFLVDTGAIDCLAPASALRAAGILIEGKDVYELANGEFVEYPYGFARTNFMGSETVTQIILGPEECEPILGVVALENTGIGVDPVSRGLKRMSAKPLKLCRQAE
jgi:clan AA aspartic protease